jgi:hypothetical protein
MPVQDLKKKMTTLLASYRKEKSRVKKSHITGSGTNIFIKLLVLCYSFTTHFSFLFLFSFDNVDMNMKAAAARAVFTVISRRELRNSVDAGREHGKQTNEFAAHEQPKLKTSSVTGVATVSVSCTSGLRSRIASFTIKAL